MGRACHAPGATSLSSVVDRSMKERLEELERRRDAAFHAGSPAAVERQHSRGKMTARERIDYLLDAGSFQELDMLAKSRSQWTPEDKRAYTDGVVTGFGSVEGRKVCVFSQDFTVNGGTLGEVSGEKIHKVIDLATSLGVPLIGICLLYTSRLGHFCSKRCSCKLATEPGRTDQSVGRRAPR